MSRSHKVKGSRQSRPSDITAQLVVKSIYRISPDWQLTKFLVGCIRARNVKRYISHLEPRIAAAVQNCNLEEYYALASLKALVSKSEFFRNPDASRVALESWMKSERLCRRTNVRLSLTDRGIIGNKYIYFLDYARRLIRRILGPIDLNDLSVSRHGPGSAIGCTGYRTSGAFKYASRDYPVSSSCFNMFSKLVESDKVWSHINDYYDRRLVLVEDAEKLYFVPKNWKTDRAISVGPLGNIYIQLGIGTLLASRLRRIGIDLSSQKANKDGAREASLHSKPVYGDNYATLDLSAASDTLSQYLVKTLLPEDWYRVLNCARTSMTELPDGSKVRLQKFCAMGNGFTFPLETLIFYALSKAALSTTVHKGRVLVYGDDIIVPKGCALLLSEILRWCGFSVNPDKSYIFGDFYESCGTDYLRGVSVRPFHWKRRILSDRDIYSVVNGYRAFSSGLDDLWHNHLRDYLLSNCRDTILFGPEVASRTEERLILDDRIVTDDVSKWQTKVRHSIRYVKVYGNKQRLSAVEDDHAYLHHLHGLVGNDVASETETSGQIRSKDGTLLLGVRLPCYTVKRWICVS